MQEFALLDASGSDAPAKVPDLYTSPFGALVSNAGMCTATHLGSGLGITAAHCVHPGASYFAIFYNKQGQKVAYPVQSFPYVGDGTNDIAAFKVSDEAANAWDAAGAEVSGATDGAVRIWSYTPLQHFPTFQTRSRRWGMVFSPNRCVASQTKPHIEAWGGEPDRKLAQIDLGSGWAEADHLFFQNCERPILGGNSGSLITSESGFAKKLGVLNAHTVRKGDLTEFLRAKGIAPSGARYLYAGVDGRSEKMLWYLEEYVVGMATLLSYLAKASPGTLPSR